MMGVITARNFPRERAHGQLDLERRPDHRHRAELGDPRAVDRAPSAGATPSSSSARPASSSARRWSLFRRRPRRPREAGAGESGAFRRRPELLALCRRRRAQRLRRFRHPRLAADLFRARQGRRFRRARLAAELVFTAGVVGTLAIAWIGDRFRKAGGARQPRPAGGAADCCVSRSRRSLSLAWSPCSRPAVFLPERVPGAGAFDRAGARTATRRRRRDGNL